MAVLVDSIFDCKYCRGHCLLLYIQIGIISSTIKSFMLLEVLLNAPLYLDDMQSISFLGK